MTEQTPHTKSVMIAASDYPAMLNGTDAANFLRKLTSYETAQRAARIVDLRRDGLCDVVLDYIARMEKAAAAGDLPAVFAQAHEIRGLAGTAGLEAAGRIADGLCKYVEAASSLGATAEPAVIALHVDAISRASVAQGEALKLGNRVAVELGALVAHKLGTMNGLKNRQA
jgi:hypothetical protein